MGSFTLISCALLIIGAFFIINLTSPDDTLWQRSLDAFVFEMMRCKVLSITWNLVIQDVIDISLVMSYNGMG